MRREDQVERRTAGRQVVGHSRILPVVVDVIWTRRALRRLHVAFVRDRRTHDRCVACMCMPTNLAIDDRLLDQARTVGGYRTKRETVNEALREFIQRRQRLELAKLAGRVEYDPKYDYKRERRAR